MKAPVIHASQHTEPTGISRYSKPACLRRLHDAVRHSSGEPGIWRLHQPIGRSVATASADTSQIPSGRYDDPPLKRDLVAFPEQFTACVQRDNHPPQEIPDSVRAPAGSPLQNYVPRGGRRQPGKLIVADLGLGGHQDTAREDARSGRYRPSRTTIAPTALWDDDPRRRG